LKKYLPLILLLLVGCKESTTIINEEAEFTKELTRLKEFFHVPGMSAIVTLNDSIVYEHYFGYADIDRNILVDSTTVFHMASLTKMFSAAAIMNVEDHDLFVEEPISKYLTDKPIPDSIKIKHVLTHTSQGEVGRHFYYSNRYSWLTSVIEKKYDKSFKAVIDSLIIDKLKLKNTYLLGDSTEVRDMAKPYVFDGEVKPGFIDYGYSSAAGIASTVRDLARVSKAFDRRQLPQETLLAGFRNGYGYGTLLDRTIDDDYYSIEDNKTLDIIWAYGQYDCYSALFMKVPSRGLTFVLAANNSLLSDPARLIYGDVTTSLFALSFLKYYAIKDYRHSYYVAEEPILEDETSLKDFEERIKPSDAVRDFLLRKLKAQAVAESFMAMYDPKKSEMSKNLYHEMFKFYSTYEYADLTTLHGLMTLKEIAAHYEQPEFAEFDPQIKAIAKELLEIDVNNPYANVYMGQFYSLKSSDSSRTYYERIANAKNFSRFWYTNEAEAWLKQH
jgi:CubicO group peptidase (beta-lactamase class C family)